MRRPIVSVGVSDTAIGLSFGPVTGSALTTTQDVTGFAALIGPDFDLFQGKRERSFAFQLALPDDAGDRDLALVAPDQDFRVIGTMQRRMAAGTALGVLAAMVDVQDTDAGLGADCWRSVLHVIRRVLVAPSHRPGQGYRGRSSAPATSAWPPRGGCPSPFEKSQISPLEMSLRAK
jgi:hypothetical protein